VIIIDFIFKITITLGINPEKGGIPDKEIRRKAIHKYIETCCLFFDDFNKKVFVV